MTDLCSFKTMHKFLSHTDSQKSVPFVCIQAIMQTLLHSSEVCSFQVAASPDHKLSVRMESQHDREHLFGRFNRIATKWS